MTTNKMPDLLPCPFCGSHPVLKPFPDESKSGMFAVVCNNKPCDTSGLLIAMAGRVGSVGVEKAVEAWNTRLTPELEAALVGWRGIESAPRDGSRVVGLCADGYVCFIRWDGYGEFHIVNNGDYIDGGYGNDYRTKQYSDFSDYERVTHWMPLPPPPKGE